MSDLADAGHLSVTCKFSCLQSEYLNGRGGLPTLSNSKYLNEKYRLGIQITIYTPFTTGCLLITEILVDEKQGKISLPCLSRS